jgi:two-component system NtrC family sensor kinase
MLAAGVAHEVNNPLGAILSLTALTLEDMPADHPDRENLEEVVEQTLRCRDIVRGLLEFSRQSDLHIERVDVNVALEDTLGLIGKQALFHNIEIIRDLDPQLPAIHAGRAQVQQVFLNILLNAAQAIETSGTITLVTRRRTGEEGDRVEIEIADTGRGIPPQDIGRIFDPFFTTKRAGMGTGLGLSIAYGIVTRHGGTITVDSEPGRTRFRIQLPVDTLVAASAVDGAVR